MKLLFDQNLSFRLPDRLADIFPNSTHVRNVGLRDADDRRIWSYAAEQGYVIVSKDSDFDERSRRLGHPPKVVWIRLGNCSTAEVEALLRRHHADLLTFEHDAVAELILG